MKKMFALFVLLFVASLASAQSFPELVSYPVYDLGWVNTGQVGSLGCGGACTYTVGNNSGQYSGFTHSWGFPYEPAGPWADYQKQANNSPSFSTLTFSVVSAGTYKVSIMTWGQQLNGVYPILNVTINGQVVSLCTYPNNTAITCTPNLRVNATGANAEYATTAAVSLFAGNNTIAVGIAGGTLNGGELEIGNVVVYSTAHTQKADCGCKNASNVWQNSTVTGSGMFALNTACRNYAATACGASKQSWIELTGARVSGSGCSNGFCRMLDLD